MRATQVVTLLSASIGKAKANEVVLAAMKKRGLTDRVSRDQALEVLEDIAKTEGIVGIAARFVKVKVALLPD